MLFAVRGATDVPEDSPEAIRSAVSKLITALVEANRIVPTQALTVFFTATPDLVSMNPALALRNADAAWNSVPLLCSQEMIVAGMMPRVIRVLIQWQPTAPPTAVVPVYQGGTAALRPDLEPPV